MDKAFVEDLIGRDIDQTVAQTKQYALDSLGQLDISDLFDVICQAVTGDTSREMLTERLSDKNDKGDYPWKAPF